MGKKLTDGSSITDISIGTWNDMVDAAEEYKRRRRGLVPDPTIPNPEGFIKLKNNAATLTGGEALVVGDYLLGDPDRLHLWLDGDKPDGDHRDHYAMFPVTSKKDTISWAMLQGVGIFHVNKLSEYHRYVKLSPGGGLSMFPSSYFPPEYFTTGYFGSGSSDRPKLNSDWFGAGEIIKWLEEPEEGEDGGPLKALVRISSRTWPTYRCKTLASFGKGTTASVRFYYGKSDDKHDSGTDIEGVYNPHVTVPFDKWVNVGWVGGPDDGGIELVGREC